MKINPRQCQSCDRKFVGPSRANRYCSIECNPNVKKPQTRPCVICQKSFVIKRQSVVVCGDDKCRVKFFANQAAARREVSMKSQICCICGKGFRSPYPRKTCDDVCKAKRLAAFNLARKNGTPPPSSPSDRLPPPMFDDEPDDYVYVETPRRKKLLALFFRFNPWHDTHPVIHGSAPNLLRLRR